MKSSFFKAAAKLCLAVSASLASAFSFAAYDPVIMIPGMHGTEFNMWAMRDNLKANGWPSNILFTWTDKDQMNVDMEASAKAISAKVDEVLAQTGAKKVVLATWSASTIAGRYYLKNLGGTAKVSHFISFAGPHHGISIWERCSATETGCRNQWGPIPNTAWLNALNSGTEVPGSPTVKYLTLRGSADQNATPIETAILVGADENVLINGADHFSIITNATALAKMRSFINGYGSTTTSTTSTSTLGTGTSTTSTTTTTSGGVCFTATNSAHVAAGRAYGSFGLAYAKGSSQYLGYNNSFVTTTLKRINPYYYVKGTCN